MLIRLSSNEALVMMSLRLQGTNALKKQNSIDSSTLAVTVLAHVVIIKHYSKQPDFIRDDVNQLITPPNALL